MTLVTLVPAPLHIFALRVVHWLRVRWWRRVKPAGLGCRVVAIDPQGRVLLVRHSYGSDVWMLPGGGMGRGEDVIATGVREAFEEAGVRLADPVEVGGAHEVEHGPGNRFLVVAGWTDDPPRPDGREILDARFFALDALPQPLGKTLAELLPGYVTAATAARLRLREDQGAHPPPAKTA